MNSPRLPILWRITKKASGRKAADRKDPTAKGKKKKAGAANILLSGLSVKLKKKNSGARTVLAKAIPGRTASTNLVDAEL